MTSNQTSKIDDREKLRVVEIDAYANEATLAGATEEEVEGLRAALKGQARKDTKVRKIREQIAAMREKKLQRYYVQGPGFLQQGGERLAPGDVVKLTPLEAAELGSVVGKDEPEPPPPAADEREGGRYRFDGPGSIVYEGKHLGPGAIVTLGRDEARSMTSIKLTPLRDSKAASAA